LGVAFVLALRHVTYLNGANVTFVDPGTDLLMSAAFAGVLAFIMLDFALPARRRVEAVARRLAPLGDMSYSLYIVHYPWLALISAWWLWQNPRLPLGAELVIAGALTSLALGWCLWYFVERHCVSSKSTVRFQKTVSAPPVPALWEEVVPAQVAVSST
jgi:peptidoglycan/LPS O-acetylase OafA/YrhL